MIITVDQFTSSGQPAAYLVANLPDWSLVHLQVLGANTIRIGKTADELRMVNPGSILSGLQINQAMGVISLWWRGQLWVAGSAPSTNFDVQIIN